MCSVSAARVGRNKRNTNHNVNDTIAIECVFEEGDLVLPVGHVALDRRSLAMGPDFSSRSSPVGYETESPVTYPPFLVMVSTTASAPGAFMSPITTLALMGMLAEIQSSHRLRYYSPILREGQRYLLSNTARPSY